MRLTVSYEWIVEELDEHLDVIDVNHFDDLPEAIEDARLVVDSDDPDIVGVQIALRRDELGPDGSADGDRQYWYFGKDGLVGDPPPPKRYAAKRCPREFWGKEGF